MNNFVSLSVAIFSLTSVFASVAKADLECVGCYSQVPTIVAANNGGPEVQVTSIASASGSCMVLFSACWANIPCAYSFEVTISGLTGDGWTKQESHRNYPSASQPPLGEGWRLLPEAPASNGTEPVSLVPICGYTRDFQLLLMKDGVAEDGASIRVICDNCSYVTVIEP
jgi:hypothetical protein